MIGNKLGKEFEELRRQKIEARSAKHKGEVLKFASCFVHLLEEFAELILVIKSADKDRIAEELADLANCCEFAFIALKDW